VGGVIALLVRGDHDGGTVQSLETIQAQLGDLLAVIDRAESEHAEAIGLVASEHRAGAVNLVHYTALRQRDIRDLQIDLLDLGATSLATTEADVRAKIMAARNVVAALSGASGHWDVDINNQALDLGDTTLAGNALAVFATTRPGTRPESW
jgi:pyruvate kinase